MKNRFLPMISIILAGEAIFMIPFMIPRLYRPLMLEVWGLSNTDLGIAFSFYGVFAMVSYFLGGPLADKYHPRFLISSSLFLTSIGCVFLLLNPSALALKITYAFFGVSTILLLWGALIKTTHIAGGENKRSTAMGLLDGGRGLSAAVVSSLIVFTVNGLYPDLKTVSSQANALTLVYILTALFASFVGVLIWFSLKGFEVESEQTSEWSVQTSMESLKSLNVWLLSIVILSAYCGYKSIDNYSIYLVDVQKQSLSDSSIFTSITFWLRPISALAAGVIADRYHLKNPSGRFIILTSLLLLSGLAQLLLAFTGHIDFYYSFVIILSSAAFAFALRAIYFSVFGDLKIPTHLIGTTVGIVSLVGFLPDVFFGVVTGSLIDTFPGPLGYSYSFVFTAVCLFLGTIASFTLYRRLRITN